MCFLQDLCMPGVSLAGSSNFSFCPCSSMGSLWASLCPWAPMGRFTTQITAPSADGQYPLRIDYIPPGASSPAASTTDTLNVGTGQRRRPQWLHNRLFPTAALVGHGCTLAQKRRLRCLQLALSWSADFICHSNEMLNFLFSLRLLREGVQASQLRASDQSQTCATVAMRLSVAI